MSEALYLQTLSDAARFMEELPLWGTPPPFPFEEFSKALTKALEIDSVKISFHKTEWKDGENLLEGMGKNPLIQTLALSPLPGSLFFVLPKTAADTLFHHLLPSKTKGFTDPILEEGFTTYLFLQVLETVSELNPLGNLVACLEEQTELPEEGAVALDISIKLNQAPFWGRILIPQKTQASFKTHFSMVSPPLLSDPAFSTLPLTLTLGIGHTTLTTSDWSRVGVGDLILLESCSIDPSSGKGTTKILLGNHALFDARIKDKELKILDYALTSEAHSMTENPPNNFEEPPIDEDEEKHLWAPEDEESKPLTLPKDIPLHIMVELGSLKMPLEKVTQLRPGNVVDLGLGPQYDVHLVVAGKRIAKGELVNLGNTIGVKILALGE